MRVSMVRRPRLRLAIGSAVDLTFEAADQDGYGFRALVVVPECVDPDDDRTVHGGPGGAYSSSLTITFDDRESPAS